MARALVTGSGARLGQAMALFLAGRGFDVAVHFASSADGADETVKAIQAMGQNAVALQADLLDPGAVDGLIPRASTALNGPLMLLVNNASIFEHDTLASASHESWDHHFGSNLRAPFFLTQAFAAQAPKEALDETGEVTSRALVVNMIDQRVKKLTPEFMTYSLAKAGLWALTQTAAQALAPAIRVNAIAPGPTIIGTRQSKDHFARQRSNTILQRGANPQDVTSALGYFLDAVSVTGQLIAVDGGQHLGWKTPDILGVE
ncbi:MAG: SDR family oxidoreductase [Rhodobacteraceae bacterium]|nr:SDR family oxidoreductase [Paracoccaceae bacterium]